MSCAHTSQHLLKMLRLPLRSASAFSPSRIHRFTTGHTARKSLGLSVFCFINRSVSWDPCSWVEPSVETPGGPAPAPADSSHPGEKTRQLCVTSDSTLLFVSSCAAQFLTLPSSPTRIHAPRRAYPAQPAPPSGSPAETPADPVAPLVHPSDLLISGDHGTYSDLQNSPHPRKPFQNFHSAAGLDFWFEDMSRRVSGHWLNDASRTQLGPELFFLSSTTTHHPTPPSPPPSITHLPILHLFLREGIMEAGGTKGWG